MGKILGFTRRSVSMGDKVSRNPAALARVQQSLGAAEALPFDLETIRSNQLRLAMFRRANPGIAFAPADFGADGTKDIDGDFGARSKAAAKSYVDFRFGRGVVAMQPGDAGVPASEVTADLRDALYADASYIEDPALAVPYYNAIMGLPHGPLPALPRASEFRWKLTRGTQGPKLDIPMSMDEPSGQQIAARAEHPSEQAGTNVATWIAVGLAGVAAAAALWFLPRRRR